MLIQAKDLSSQLLGKKIVKVRTKKGEEVEFEIQKVNIESFAGKSSAVIENIMGKSQEEVKQMFLDRFKKQEISSVISPILLEGIANPIVVDKEIIKCDLEKEIPVKVLLLDLELATSLYSEILELSIVEK